LSFNQLNPRIQIEEKEDDYGRFVIEPLPRGYGHTIGNPLRRVLLSSLPGSAITSVTVEGVLHEYASLEFMREDVVQFILNLKDVKLLLHGPGPYQARIEMEGPGQITDSDIKTSPEVEIVHPEHYLATLDKGGALRVELTIRSGIGYVGSEEQSDTEIGVIPLDARFTPVTKVQYSVDSARVGQSTDYDRLVVQVWTDGSIAPDDAISRASTILMESYTLMSQVANPELFEVVEEEEEEEEIIEISTPVEDLQLSNRALNCLKRHEIDTVEQLDAMAEEELQDLRGMGVKLIDEIRERLAEHRASEAENAK